MTKNITEIDRRPLVSSRRMLWNFRKKCHSSSVGTLSMNICQLYLIIVEHLLQWSTISVYSNTSCSRSSILHFHSRCIFQQIFFPQEVMNLYFICLSSYSIYIGDRLTLSVDISISCAFVVSTSCVSVVPLVSSVTDFKA